MVSYPVFDEEGNLTLSNEGIAITEYKYDDNGNEVLRQFFDKDNKPTKGYIGFAQKAYTYDDKGHMLSERYYDINNIYYDIELFKELLRQEASETILHSIRSDTFKDPVQLDNESEDNPLAKYSTSQLKAELRRRKGK